MVDEEDAEKRVIIDRVKTFEKKGEYEFIKFYNNGKQRDVKYSGVLQTVCENVDWDYFRDRYLDDAEVQGQ